MTDRKGERTVRHLFIINPAAGKKSSTHKLMVKLEQLKEKLEFEVAMTETAGDAERIARDAIEQGEPIRIYACGGDGTLNEVVNAAAGYDHAAITNVAKGTGNDFLKIFGKNWREGFTDLEALAAGPQAAFDVIDCGGKLGLGVACAGIDARVARDVHRYKSLPLVGGMGAYILALIDNVICKSMIQPMKVTASDGYRYDGKISLICACNGRYYGGGFMPVGEAMPDDGVLDFLIVRGVTRLQFLKLVKKYATGRYRECASYLHHVCGDQVAFSSEEEIVAVVDGEIVAGQEFTIKLSEKKVNFFWPEYLDYHLTEKTAVQAQI